MTWNVNNVAENNPMWKGDEVGYGALHEYIRRRKVKPSMCERCALEPAVDLANRSGEYLRDLSDWEYLCRRCHMHSDGRAEQLRLSGRARKLPDKNCEVCGSAFHPDKEISKFCSRKCYFSYRKGMVTNPSGTNQWSKQ